MCWHKWDKWIETANGELFKYPDSSDLSKKVHVGQVSYQERACQKCGKKQLLCETARIVPDYTIEPRITGREEHPNAESAGKPVL